MSESSVDDKINKLIEDNRILLFMKGTKTNLVWFFCTSGKLT